MSDGDRPTGAANDDNCGGDRPEKAPRFRFGRVTTSKAQFGNDNRQNFYGGPWWAMLLAVVVGAVVAGSAGVWWFERAPVADAAAPAVTPSSGAAPVTSTRVSGVPTSPRVSGVPTSTRTPSKSPRPTTAKATSAAPAPDKDATAGPVIPHAVYRLRNDANGYCLGQRLAKSSSGRTMVDYNQENCADGKGLEITGEPGDYRLADGNAGCVAPDPQWIGSDKNTVIPVACDGSAGTRWDIRGDATYRLVDRADPSRCLTGKQTSSLSTPTYLRMYGCGAPDQAALQSWRLDKIAG